ncbi:tyrosine-type recombinase/integrase [Gemmatimonas sp. UBA7669]|uniref:tyrosine-type recombinase/integrase n=1 Tax=Gemmatimonas sp. UBA7669 TaxID=1946568 RepID=UPI0025C06C77|nr:tyrosine-type recombinase/integrase [Gemmatimonas sp. UBA7669]
MVYRKAGGKTWYTRVVTTTGAQRVLSTGTTLKTEALAVERWHQGVRRRLDVHGVLEAIVESRVSLVQAYRLGEVGVVAHFQQQAEQAAAEARQAAADAANIDLRPHLDAFLTWRGQRTRGQSVIPIYRQQLTRLFPEPEWRRDWFTAQLVAARLDALTGVQDATRNRYRAAVSAFAKYLVRRGLVAHNPARDIGGYEENEAEVIWWSEADARRLIAALPELFRGREALMAGTGMDWTDCQRLRVRDVDLAARTVRCHGSKTAHRNRVVRITEAWTLPYIRAAVAHALPEALVCPPHSSKVANRVHRETLEALDITPVARLHAWRHHYAVTLLRRGELPQVVAHQCGHGTVKLVLDRYGKFLPNAADYLPDAAVADPATDPATLPQSGPRPRRTHHA